MQKDQSARIATRGMDVCAEQTRRTFTTIAYLMLLDGPGEKDRPSVRLSGGPVSQQRILHKKEFSYMAKGQQRSNREPKKPKQNKPKKIESTLSKVTETFRAKPRAISKSGGK
ncbi:hypothetical protein [Hyphococcus luteus]|uniref:Uncharacterized protein n=1 Tax=Hyphococcus luteus TaxID=2058213 RepID=A0A2S7K6Y3_9PROT|nr:hypothetical protein [Marinicaulis flavus]PQA88239.1 hypothetical protein CW354_08010 [Marinicaulis flavus]